MTDHEEDIKFDVFQRFSLYFQSLEQIVMRNEARALEKQKQDLLNNMPVEGKIPPVQQ